MKITELAVGTAYLIGSRGYARDPGALLDTGPWLSRGERSHRYDSRTDMPRLERDPDGRLGKRWGTVSSTYGDVRGLLTVCTGGYALTQDYIGDPDDPEDPTRTVAVSVAERDARVAALPEVAAAMLAAVEADPMAWPKAPEGYSFHVVRPQDIVQPWAEHVEQESRAAQQRAAAAVRDVERAAGQAAARQRLIAAIEPPESELTPYGLWSGTDGMRRSWTDMEAMCERYAAAKAPAGPLPELAACAVQASHGPHVYHAATRDGVPVGDRTCPGVTR